MTDEELFAGLPGVTPAAPPTNGAPSPSKGPASLSKIGIGRGGIIRNPTTKRRQQLNNPVTNPRPPKGGAVRDSTPEQQLKAEHPALAFPSVLTGMDLDINKRASEPLEAPAPEPPRAPEPAAPTAWQPPPEAEPVPMTTTLAQLLVMAATHGGIWHVGKPEWLCAIQIRSPELINFLQSRSLG